jgi:hypothetical protein
MSEDHIPGRFRDHALRNVGRHERDSRLIPNRQIPESEPS